jgi:hypothetical protein
MSHASLVVKNVIMIILYPSPIYSGPGPSASPLGDCSSGPRDKTLSRHANDATMQCIGDTHDVTTGRAAC